MFTRTGQPHGHGKIERLIGTVNQMCLAHLPGYAPRGTPDRASQAQLTLPQLDAAIGRFIREVYTQRPHSETKTPPQARREAGAFIPRMPTSLEQLDLLLFLVLAADRAVLPGALDGELAQPQSPRHLIIR
ncbi:hypothetical protein GCM10022224_019090 [Nonomuraea antimicrobica]|uniref:DDE superfamily endonuclease n=1 Tax=Nonomuraea antimicrobica TaxID=561173 RepID=A0ABP7BDH6_9ACTN